MKNAEMVGWVSFLILKPKDDGKLRLFSGGVDANENIQTGIIREVTEESGLYDFKLVEKVGEGMAHYYNSLRKVNRVTHSTCLLLVLSSRKMEDVHLEAHETFSLYWATAQEILDDLNKNNANKDNDHWIYFFNKSTDRLKELGY
jgi:NADH pyrophosphatase NudC (nudix superfamily)